MNNKKRPLGVLILGLISCFVFGLLFLLLSLVTYFNPNPQQLEIIKDQLQGQTLGVEINAQLIKAASIAQAVISCVFLVAGTGLLLGERWGRNVALYFSFGWAILVCLISVTNPAFMKQMIFQLMFPGCFIIYLTNKKVDGYFSFQGVEENEVLENKE